MVTIRVLHSHHSIIGSYGWTHIAYWDTIFLWRKDKGPTYSLNNVLTMIWYQYQYNQYNRLSPCFATRNSVSDLECWSLIRRVHWSLVVSGPVLHCNKISLFTLPLAAPGLAPPSTIEEIMRDVRVSDTVIPPPGQSLSLLLGRLTPPQTPGPSVLIKSNTCSCATSPTSTYRDINETLVAS